MLLLLTSSIFHFFFPFFFFFNDTATTEIYTLSLHDALPISPSLSRLQAGAHWRTLWHRRRWRLKRSHRRCQRDRKSTRLNSSHVEISYAVFCLKKKKKKNNKKIKHTQKVIYIIYKIVH